MANDRLRVGLYVNDAKATTLRLVRCLEHWQMAFVSIRRDELADLRPGDFDVLLLHGGWYGIDRVPGQEQYDKEATPEHECMAGAVNNFVRQGGGIVGLCCGAFNIVWLGLIAADISRTAGVGPHSLEVVNERHPVAAGVIQRAKGRKDRRWQPIPTPRINGPIFFPHDPGDMVFSYDWEHRLGAVLAAEVERGRAVAISPHPERALDDLGDEMPAGPPPPTAEILRRALVWRAGRTVEGEAE